MPVILAFGRLREENHFSLGIRDQPWQYSKILSPKQMEKNFLKNNLHYKSFGLIL
jgi:hypothetical protein